MFALISSNPSILLDHAVDLTDLHPYQLPSPFESISIGTIEVKNRIAMAPVKTAYAATDGRVTDRHLAYFRRRARGGVGLIVSEPLYIDKRGQEHPKQLGIDSEDKLDGLRNLVDAIQQNGSMVLAHLNHAGRAANPKAAGGPPEAPSNVPCPRTGFAPSVLTEMRIEKLIYAFADAALRAKKAGFDGVELQFGLGYLVSQFLSSATNRREDLYGGDLENRMRFPQDVFTEVRRVVGDDFPIGVRISGSEKAPDGLEIEDAKELAVRLETWGADLIHVVTGSNCESLPWYFQHMSLPYGVNEKLAVVIKESVDLPVMVAGRLGDPPRIREVIGSGMADMVALGRPLLADPDLPKKMSEGKDDEVLLCGHCLQACFVRVKSGQGLGCNFNPEVGWESEKSAPADHPKHVVVVGGGPAGIQAALTARKRGHRVTLFEKGELGGQFALAFLAPGKERIEQTFRSLVARLRRSGVELRLKEEATCEKLMEMKPDAVILATGSTPIVPDIPGLGDAITSEEVFTNKRQIGNDVLVVGGGMIGMEVAELLARQGKKCTVLKRSGEVAIELDPITMKLMLNRIASLPITIHTEVELACIKGGKAVIEHQGEKREIGPFDSVVVARGNKPHDPLSDGLDKDDSIILKIAGDAGKPARIYDAVRSGHCAAMAV